MRGHLSARDQTRNYLQSRFCLRPRGVGRATHLASGQSWHYPADATTVIWEVLPERSTGFDDPRESYVCRQLWTRYETFLLKHFPTTRTMMTTWEDDWGRSAWEGFLSGLGYQKNVPALFRREVQEGQAPPFP